MKDKYASFLNKGAVAVFLTKIIAVISSYMIPFCFSYFIAPPVTAQTIFLTMGVLVLLFVIHLFFNWLYYYMAEVFYHDMQFSLSRRYFNRFIHMRMSDVDNLHTGFVRSQISNLTTALTNLLKGIFEVYIPVFIGMASFLLRAFTQSIRLGIMCSLVFGLAIFIRHHMLIYSQPSQRKTRDYYSKFEGTLIDFIQNIRTIKKVDMQEFANKRLDERVLDYLRALRKSEIIQGNIYVVFNGLIYFSYILVLHQAILMVNAGESPVSFIVFYISIMGRVKDSMSDFAQSMAVVVNYRHIKEQLDDYLKKEDKEPLITSWKTFGLKRVLFSYDQRTPEENTPRLQVDEFEVEKGQNISVYGESGSGKTTLLNILSGSRDVEMTSFFVDHKPKGKGRLRSVFISPDTELFDMSIYDNLTVGRKVEEVKLSLLLEEMGLKSWIDNLPEGLETIVGEKGMAVSTGQKQRLLILRAILMEEDLYFFDEPTSYLDEQAEEQVMNVLNKYIGYKTLIIATNKPKLHSICQKHYKIESGDLVNKVIPRVF